jgi:hypothetical protein
LNNSSEQTFFKRNCEKSKIIYLNINRGNIKIYAKLTKISFSFSKTYRRSSQKDVRVMVGLTTLSFIFFWRGVYYPKGLNNKD